MVVNIMSPGWAMVPRILPSIILGVSDMSFLDKIFINISGDLVNQLALHNVV